MLAKATYGPGKIQGEIRVRKFSPVGAQQKGVPSMGKSIDSMKDRVSSIDLVCRPRTSIRSLSSGSQTPNSRSSSSSFPSSKMTSQFKSLNATQWSCLISLTLYTSGLSFLMHLSRKDALHQYSVTTSVFLAELLKLAISCGMEHRDIILARREVTAESQLLLEKSPTLEEKELHLSYLPSHHTHANTSSRHDVHPVIQIMQLVFSRECLRLGLPALLYLIQNSLQLYGITVVSAGTYQALTQMKILAASLLSVWLLGRSYSRQQWLSVLVLVIGVTILSSSKLDASAKMSALAISRVASPAVAKQILDSLWSEKSLGVISVLAACAFGSGGAVIMEQSVKDGKSSLWIRNAQLSFFSLLPAGFALLYSAFTTGTFHPMKNFGAWAWCAVLARSAGGFLISYVLKQCDAIMKGIATSLAMILSLSIECLFLGQGTSFAQIFGALLVLISSVTYIRYRLA